MFHCRGRTETDSRITAGQQCAAKSTLFFPQKTELYEHFSPKIPISHGEFQVFHNETITFGGQKRFWFGFFLFWVCEKLKFSAVKRENRKIFQSALEKMASSGETLTSEHKTDWVSGASWEQKEYPVEVALLFKVV